MNRCMMDTTWIVHGKYLDCTWRKHDYENNVHADIFRTFLLDCVVILFGESAWRGFFLMGGGMGTSNTSAYIGGTGP